jgi:uncharacterized membrane protein HdeD (DUF308 family)
VTDSVDDATARTRYWPVPILRAIPAVVVAAIITFSSNHAAGLGLVLFGAFAVVEGLLFLLIAPRRMPTPTDRRVTFLQGVATLVAGLVGFGIIATDVAGFKVLVIVWAVVAGAIELIEGIRARRTSPFARDWQTIGGLTVLLAIAFLLTPTGYTKDLGGIEHIKGTLDSSVILVGLFGAYLAITAVFHVIAGLSHKWGTAAPAQPSPDGAPHA